jgi:hypothetical protein
VGHEIRSRATVTIVNNTRVVDRATGTASYGIDLPNGGAASITNNSIEKGPLSENPAIISFGEEGGVYSNTRLTVSGNIIANLLVSPSVVGVRNTTSVTAHVDNDQTYGLTASQIVSGPAEQSGNVFLSAAPTISTAHPWAK